MLEIIKNNWWKGLLALCLGLVALAIGTNKIPGNITITDKINPNKESDTKPKTSELKVSLTVKNKQKVPL